jgi:hypothetical protein
MNVTTNAVVEYDTEAKQYQSMASRCGLSEDEYARMLCAPHSLTNVFNLILKGLKRFRWKSG